LKGLKQGQAGAQRHKELNYHNRVNEYNKKLGALVSLWHNLKIDFSKLTQN
jgi:hypothetical protein